MRQSIELDLDLWGDFVELCRRRCSGPENDRRERANLSNPLAGLGGFRQPAEKEWISVRPIFTFLVPDCCH